MVKLANIKFIQRRKKAIKAVLERCLPDFMNRIFLHIIGVQKLDLKLPIENAIAQGSIDHSQVSNNIDKTANEGDNDENAYCSASDEDYITGSDDEEQEDVRDYCKGGYHVVNIGDLFHGRYHVIRKLGWGHFSTVWLAWDLLEKRYVALKIVKSASHYTETAIDEMKLLRTVHTACPDHEGYPHVVQLLDDFKISGIHGNHVCMVFEVLGHNLLKYIIKSNYRGISIAMCKTIIKQTLMGLNYLHTVCKVIHTDIKPENILVCITEEEIQRLALNATQASQQGKVPRALTACAPKHIIQKQSESSAKLSKNKKKKIKQKIKKQLQKHQQLLDEELGEEVVNFQNNNVDRLHNSHGTEIHHNKITPPKTLNIEPIDKKEHVDEFMETGSPFEPLATEFEQPIDAEIPCDFEEPIAAEVAENLLEFCQNIHPASIHPSNAHPVAFALVSTDVRMGSVDKNNDELDSQKSRSNNDIRSREELRKERKDGSIENGSSVEVDLAEKLKIVTSERDVSFLDNPDIQVKLADLGNACWVDHHFTEEIQTRQYRSLEVLLGAGYGPPADIWSTACMAFELVTGDFLFEPHSGEDWSRDEDHIALIMELLGRIPRHVALSGKYSKEFFTRKGELKHIKRLKPWSLESVLCEKYDWSTADARAFAEFLEPMMDFVPENRATAAQCLMHPWLNS
ncbi:SRSF protein kinase 3 isoform X2 [Hydra vulgaris]|uniref:SRSF protein kinase 3 isoform X2 n=1 Tax=Hydra vulgaris TaxID=6087 RepID=UPI0032E9F3A5